MQPLGFLRPAKPMEAIYCCSAAEPILSPGSYKVHNDPNRDLHDSIFSSFMNFVLRRQRQSTLLQLALSHVEESTGSFDEALATSALEFVTGTNKDSVIPSSAISAHSLGQSTDLTDVSASQALASQPGAQSSASTFQVPSTVPVSSLPANPGETYQGCQPVSSPEPSTDQTSSSYNESNLPTQTIQQAYTRGYTTPTRLAGSAGLSVTARPFVPGLARGSLPPGFAAALSNTHSPSTTTLPTLYEGLRSSVGLADDTTTTQHTIGQQSEISELQGHGYSTAGHNSLALLGLLSQQTQPVLSAPLMPSLEPSTSLSNTSQHFANTGHTDHHAGISSIAETLQNANLTTLQQPSTTTIATNPMGNLEKEPQHLISAPSSTAPMNSQPQPNTWFPGHMFPNAAPRNNQPQLSPWIPSHTLPNAAPFNPVPQSVLSPTSVLSSSRQNTFVSESISPPVIMSESRGQAAAFSHNRTHSYGTPRSSSAGSWRSHAPVSNSAFSSSQRQKPRSNNSYTSTSTQPRTVASSSRQTQQHQEPQPTVLFDMEAAKNNPLTESTSFVIHLTSRLDYGPVESHRYFICPQDLNDDWIELTLFQWWCRGESFKMKAEKWDVKCKKHDKFFRMTLRPNLKMRDDFVPSFGPSGPRQPE